MAPRSEQKGKPKKFRVATKARDLSRRAPSRKIGKTVLIVCEDEKSSPDYFKKLTRKLELKPVNVEICGKECGSDPKSVVNYAQQRKNDAVNSPVRDSYDVVFCVVDVDKHKPDSLNAAIQKARDNDIKLIISNPCFEYWYILHFEKTGSKYYDHHKPQSDLRKTLGKIYKDKHYKYDKGCCGFFDKVYPKTATAIKNSKAILREQHHNEGDLSKCNPSTHVHLVVECLKKIAKESN